ncbi:MAG: hypothetical protein GX442_12770 [Candidatus Riflebacteria bacterium]|nr:hypothetical protein [Candidatus Riflebacteria bacterium]
MGMPFPGMPPMMMPPRGPAKDGPLALFVLADKLKLTDEQLVSLRHIFKKFRDGMADLKKRERDAQKEFRNLLASDKEEAGLTGLPATLGKMAEERATIMVTALVEARKVLDADQFKAVRKVVRKMFAPPIPKPGKKVPGFRGPGKKHPGMRPGPFGAGPHGFQPGRLPRPSLENLCPACRARCAWDKIVAPKPDEPAPPPPPAGQEPAPDPADE